LYILAIDMRRQERPRKARGERGIVHRAAAQHIRSCSAPPPKPRRTEEHVHAAVLLRDGLDALDEFAVFEALEDFVDRRLLELGLLLEVLDPRARLARALDELQDERLLRAQAAEARSDFRGADLEEVLLLARLAVLRRVLLHEELEALLIDELLQRGGERGERDGRTRRCEALAHRRRRESITRILEELDHALEERA
jgi:hypothetical protein